MKWLLLICALVSTSLRAEIPVRYWILHDGTPAVAPVRTVAQTAALNLWYAGLARFTHAGTTIVTESYLDSIFLPSGCDKRDLQAHVFALDANAALDELSYCLGAASAINIFIVKKLAYAGGRELNGIAMMGAPLGASRNPGVVVSANIFFNAAITLSHEIGHVLGFHHTATGADIPWIPVYWHTVQACDVTVSYPHFHMPDPWAPETNPQHVEYPGRRTPMGYLNMYSFIAPSFLAGEYGVAFKKIVECWRLRSFSAAAARRYRNQVAGGSIAD